MQYDNLSPIYQQIMNDIKEKIMVGEYAPNMQIAPVRELAIIYEVNPNTMQRALTELEKEGYLYTLRTAGRFVIDDVKYIKALKEKWLQQKVKVFLQELQAFQMQEEDIMKYIKEGMKNHVEDKKYK